MVNDMEPVLVQVPYLTIHHPCFGSLDPSPLFFTHWYLVCSCTNALSSFLELFRHRVHNQKSMVYERELTVAKQAVVAACRLCQAVRLQQCDATTTTTLASMTKADQSPVTVADYGSQAVICRALQQRFPEDSVVAEEDASDLRTTTVAAGGADAGVLDQITRHVQQTLQEDETPSATDILNYIDHGNGNVRAKGRFWTLDPIDGTKGFLRGDQYAVCLALIQDGQVKLGVLGCPALRLPSSQDGDDESEEEEGHLLTAIQGQGCFRESLRSQIDDNPLSAPPPVPVSVSTQSTTVVQSFEASHGNDTAQERAAQALGLAPTRRMDSQAKYAIVAAGQAALYLRLSMRPQNIWDHAAGSLLVQEAGGVVTDRHGRALDWTDARMMHNSGVVVSNGHALHAKALEVLKQQEQQT